MNKPNRHVEEYISLSRSELKNHYHTQNSIWKRTAKKPVLNQIGEFLSINIAGWLYHYFKSRFGRKHPFLTYEHKENNGIYEMRSGQPGKARLVVAADWGTDTEESVHIGKQMLGEGGDYTIHLGDTYFVGAPQEIESNFLIQGNAWPRGKYGTLGIPGNHEFYSNGKAYFEKLLPHMYVETLTGRQRQLASYFCLENDCWRILGLDTGYHSVGKPILELIFPPDARLDNAIIKWLQTQVQLTKQEKKGLILLSHHQYCSAFEEQYLKPAQQLNSFIGNDVIWLWGHEHRFAVYGKYQYNNGITAYGRCIGHGGMPIALKQPNARQLKTVDLIFNDNRQYKIVDNEPVGHNGYAVLDFDGNKLAIQYKDETSCIFREEWQVDNLTGKIMPVPASQ